MLEPAIVGARIGRDGPAAWREEFGQLDKLVSQAHARRAHAQTEYAFQVLVFRAVEFTFGYLFEGQHLGIELDGAIEIGNRHADRVDRHHQRSAIGSKQRGVGEKNQERSAQHFLLHPFDQMVPDP